MTTERIVLQREWVDLRSVLQSAVKGSQPLIESAGHAFSMRRPQEAVYLESDSTRLAQVFLNLLNNAAKHIPLGGQVEIQPSRDRGEAAVRVRVNGVGH